MEHRRPKYKHTAASPLFLLKTAFQTSKYPKNAPLTLLSACYYAWFHLLFFRSLVFPRRNPLSPALRFDIDQLERALVGLSRPRQASARGPGQRQPTGGKVTGAGEPVRIHEGLQQQRLIAPVLANRPGRSVRLSPVNNRTVCRAAASSWGVGRGSPPTARSIPSFGIVIVCDSSRSPGVHASVSYLLFRV